MSPTNKTFPWQEGSLKIDIKRIFSQALRYWYLIVLSVAVCLTAAFLINRYATRTYSINASIIIKEAEEVSGAELLYNNPLVKFHRNYLNEIYIIKSHPIIERTVSDLNYDHTFYKIGNLITSEAYGTVPFKVDVISNPGGLPFSFKFTIVDEDKAQISATVDGQEKEWVTKFGDEVKLGATVLKLNKTEHAVLKRVSPGEQFMFSYRDVVAVAKSYISRLNADWAEEGAGVINLSMVGSNTQKEIDFLNSLIRNYQNYDLEKKNLAASNTINFINLQLEDISDSLNNAERQLQTFKDKNVVTDLNSEALRLYQKIEGLEVQKSDLVIRNNYYKYLSDYIKESPDLDQVILPTSVGISDPILTGLVSELITVQTEIKMMTRQGKLQHPALPDKTKRVKQLQNDIVESMQNQKSIDKIKLDFLNKQIREVEKQLNYLPVAERQLVNIKRNYALLENLYIFLLQKRAEAGISKASNTSDIVEVNPPMLHALVSPNTVRNYFFGLSLGLILPFSIFICLELFNSRVQSREDIQRLTTIPCIGGVGHKRTAQNTEVLQRPKSAISESFRALRSNLNYYLQGKQSGVFLITSSISGEGKTFSSINLASVFALSGKRTLIIGADMRRPRIFSDFNLTNDKGLSSYLANLSSFDEIVQKTEYSSLDLVSAGPVPPNPSELIMGKRMEEFLESAKAKYDYIFIDSPPLALVTDAFVLSGMVDHTLFIVRQNYTPKGLLTSIDDFYKEGKIKRISIVLNDIYKSGLGYGYGPSYGYGYGYGYGAEGGKGYYSD